jgi:hypothetical protein
LLLRYTPKVYDIELKERLSFTSEVEIQMDNMKVEKDYM